MSFTFGQFSFADFLPTSHAIQREFPNMSNLGVESLEVPGMERRRFLQTDRPFTGITFDVILHADSAEELETRRDQLMMLLDPALGPQTLVLDDHPDWYWTATVSDEIVWEKLTWGCEYRGYRYRADFVFETYGDAASRHAEDGEVSVSGSTQVQLEGNTRSWPRWEFSESLGSDQSVTFTMSPTLDGSHTVEVQGPLSGGQTMVLDYDTMEFAVWQGTTKVASLVNRMSTLERPELHPILGEVQVSATAQRMVTYEWEGERNNSQSVKRINGTRVSRNYIHTPLVSENRSNWVITSGLNRDLLPGVGAHLKMVGDNPVPAAYQVFSWSSNAPTMNPGDNSRVTVRFEITVPESAPRAVSLRPRINVHYSDSTSTDWNTGETVSIAPGGTAVLTHEVVTGANTAYIASSLLGHSDQEFSPGDEFIVHDGVTLTLSSAIPDPPSFHGDTPDVSVYLPGEALFYPNSRRQ